MNVFDKLLQLLRQWFQRKPKLLVGVDISSNAIKALVLSSQKGLYRVESYGVIALPPSAIVENDIKDAEVVARTIENLLTESHISVKDAAIAIPDSMAITRIISIPAGLTSDEIEAQINVEAERYIPYPLNEITLDFEVIGPSKNDPHKDDVLLIASYADNIASRVAALKKGGLNVKVVEVESFAIERACQLLKDHFPNRGINEVIAVVDIGATFTTLTVLENMSTIFTRSEVFGGRQLTDEIQRHYGLPYAEAGLAKKQGGLPEDYATEVLQPFKDSLILYIRRALQFFYSASHVNNVDVIVLAGGTSAIPGLSHYVNQRLGIPVVLANPLLDMQIASTVDITALTNDVPALMLASGLALRSFTKQGLHLQKHS